MGIAMPTDLTTGEDIVRSGGMALNPDGVERENGPERIVGVDQGRDPLGQSITAQDNAPNSTPADAGKAGANIVRFMTPAQCRVRAQAMKSEELAEHVVKNGWGDVLVKLGQLKPFVEVLWDRFEGLKGKDSIAGCRTKREFCEKRLNRSIRAVQFMLYGRTPKKADRTGSDQRAEKETVGKKVKAPPPTAGPLVPDPAPGTMDELSQRINQMADTLEIGRVLESFFGGLAQSLLERHPYPPSSKIDVHVFRNGESYFPQNRIRVGDWLEHTGGCDLLAKQTGQEKALGRVVGMDKLGQPRLRWHNGRAWTKPYSLRDGYGCVRVLFDYQAARQFPEAYGSYPADGALEEPPQDQAACGRVIDKNAQGLEPTPPAACGDSHNGALPTQDLQSNPQAGLKDPVAGPGAEPPIPEAASGEQPEAAGADGDGPAPFCPGDWVTFDSTCKYLGRFVGRKGKRFLVTRYDKKRKQWSPKPTLTDWIQRRLTLEEVREKFPGAHEAWLAAESDSSVQAPDPCPPAETVYEAFADGPKVMKVTVTGEHGDAPRLKFVACSGEQQHPYATLEEAKAACDRMAGRVPAQRTPKATASVKPPERPPVHGSAGKRVGQGLPDAAGVRSGRVTAKERGRRSSTAKKGSEEYTRRKGRQQREYYQRKKQAKAKAAAITAAEQPSSGTPPRAAGIVPRGTNPRSAAQSAAY